MFEITVYTTFVNIYLYERELYIYIYKSNRLRNIRY